MLTIFGGAPTPLSPTTASSPHRVLRNRLSYSLPSRCDAARLRTGEYARRDRRGAKVKIRKPAPNADHSACRWDYCGVQSARPPQDGTDSAAWSSSAFLSNAQRRVDWKPTHRKALSLLLMLQSSQVRHSRPRTRRAHSLGGAIPRRPGRPVCSRPITLALRRTAQYCHHNPRKDSTSTAQMSGKAIRRDRSNGSPKTCMNRPGFTGEFLVQ